MWYAVYRQDNTLQSTGTVMPDAAVLVEKGLQVKSYDFNIQQKGKLWDETTQDFISVSIPRPSISVAKFKDRLTLAERSAIIGAGKSDDMIAAFLDQLNSAVQVNLDSQSMIDGMDYMVNQGLLTITRKAEVLV